LATPRTGPRGIIDTSVLVAGIAGFKRQTATLRNPSGELLRQWLESGTFVWLVSEQILTEYKEVLVRLNVRRHLVGSVVNLLREEAELVNVPFTVDVSPDPGDNAFCACAEIGNAAFIATLNPKDFPQRKLRAKVIAPGVPLPTTPLRRLR
jgi:putative PIN family toxin of toxin-antitoxin system